MPDWKKPSGVVAAAVVACVAFIVFSFVSYEQQLDEAHRTNQAAVAERDEARSLTQRTGVQLDDARRTISEQRTQIEQLNDETESQAHDIAEAQRFARADAARINDLEVQVEQLLPQDDGLNLAQQDRIWWTIFATLAPTADPNIGRAVLQCESGGVANPHTVVSPTNDVGRAQINKAAHAGKVAARWPSLSFEAAMGDPARNAVMAAVVYNDAGSWAPWACYWITTGRPVPW